MSDIDVIEDAATQAWAQIVAHSPERTFTPDDRDSFRLGFGACLVAVTAGNDAAE